MSDSEQRVGLAGWFSRLGGRAVGAFEKAAGSILSAADPASIEEYGQEPTNDTPQGDTETALTSGQLLAKYVPLGEDLGEIDLRPQQAGSIAVDMRPPVQRPISKGHVLQIRSQMECGLWTPRSPLTFARHATGFFLVDGQHRLLAQAGCSNSDLCIRWVICVIDGDPREVYARLDAVARPRPHGIRMKALGVGLGQYLAVILGWRCARSVEEVIAFHLDRRHGEFGGMRRLADLRPAYGWPATPASSSTFSIVPIQLVARSHGRRDSFPISFVPARWRMPRSVVGAAQDRRPPRASQSRPRRFPRWPAVTRTPRSTPCPRLARERPPPATLPSAKPNSGGVWAMATPTTSAKVPGVRWIADDIDAGSATPRGGGTDPRIR